MIRPVPVVVFRPPGSPAYTDDSAMSAEQYAQAIADCIRQAVALDLVPPSWASAGALTVLDADGRAEVVGRLAASDTDLAWRMLRKLAPELGQCILWLRVMRGLERRIQRGEGLLTALQQRVGGAPEPDPGYERITVPAGTSLEAVHQLHGRVVPVSWKQRMRASQEAAS